MEILNTSAYDRYDERDYPHEEIFGADSGSLPSFVLHHLAPIYDQGNTMECTIFSANKAANEENRKEMDDAGVEGRDVITTEKIKALAYEYGFTDENGGPIDGPLKALIKMGILSGYTRLLRWTETLKSVLVRGPICTGSNKINWADLRKTGYVVEKASQWPGHAFCIVGYDDEKKRFICANSYGVEYGDSGYFYIPYDVADLACFSFLFPVDVNNGSSLLRYKAQIKGLWNGERENEIMTRYEGAVVAQRIRPEFSGMIWNTKDPNGKLIRVDFANMVNHVTGRKVMWSTERPFDYITRWEAAEMAIKNLSK